MCDCHCLIPFFHIVSVVLKLVTKVHSAQFAQSISYNEPDKPRTVVYMKTVIWTGTKQLL